MCRAIRVLVVSSDEALRSGLRSAVGVEAEVVAALSRPDEAFLGTADVVIVDGRDDDAEQGLALLRIEHPSAGVVWIGDGTPPGAHVAIELVRIRDDLPGAIVRALIARR